MHLVINFDEKMTDTSVSIDFLIVCRVEWPKYSLSTSSMQLLHWKNIPSLLLQSLLISHVSFCVWSEKQINHVRYCVWLCADVWRNVALSSREYKPKQFRSSLISIQMSVFQSRQKHVRIQAWLCNFLNKCQLLSSFCLSSGRYTFSITFWSIC